MKIASDPELWGRRLQGNVFARVLCVSGTQVPINVRCLAADVQPTHDMDIFTLAIEKARRYLLLVLERLDRVVVKATVIATAAASSFGRSGSPARCAGSRSRCRAECAVVGLPAMLLLRLAGLALCHRRRGGCCTADLLAWHVAAAAAAARCLRRLRCRLRHGEWGCGCQVAGAVR